MNKKSIIAIMGPSGVGKTTLGNNLVNNLEIEIPRHCTTRGERPDDKEGFYRYLTHEQYKQKFLNNEFLISSGDGPIISKEYGNFYGVLKEDCENAWKLSNQLILFVSYKDIYSLIDLKNEYSIDIVNLTFNNIKKGVEYRLVQDIARKHTQDEIDKRINCAIEDYKKFGDLVNQYASCNVCTDEFNINETFDKVCSDLKLIKRKGF